MLRVDAPALLAAAHSLVPEIRGARGEVERSGRLPDALVARLRAAGLFELWLPAALGGPELHPFDVVQIVEVLAQADGSTAWCVAVAATLSYLGGSLAPDVGRRLLGQHQVIAGAFRPKGTAHAVAGGYRVRGGWEYGSGILHSDWVAVQCSVVRERPSANGAPELRFVFVPTRDVEVLSTWDTTGMRGTGSHDFRIHDVHVPEAHTTAAFAASPVQTGRLYRVPLNSLSVTSLAGVCLGLARAAIDALIALAAIKTPTGSAVPLRDKPRAQFAAGRAEALVRAARALLFEAVQQQWDDVAVGPASAAARTTMRLACAFCAEACAQAVDLVYAAAGGSAIYEREPIARCFRDVHTATQHIGLSLDNYERAGAVLFGHEVGAGFF